MWTVPLAATSQVPSPLIRRHDHGHRDQPPRALQRDHEPHRHERDRVGEQVPEADVQERRGDHAVEPLDVARLDPVAVEPVVERHVHDLDHPHQRHERDQDQQRVAPRIVASRFAGRTPTGPYNWRDAWPPRLTRSPASRPSWAPTIRAASPTPASRSSTPTTEDDVLPGVEERLGEPGEYPFTRGIHPDMYRGRKWTMRQYAGYATAAETNQRFRYLIEHGSTGLSMAFDLPTQLGRDSDDPLCMGEVGRTGVAIDTIDDMRRVFEGIPLGRRVDLDDDQRPGRRAAAALRAGRRGAGRAGRRAARHDPERRAQGVHRARQLHLPAGARDAPDDRPVRLLPRAHPEVEHDLDLGLPHAREGLLGRPGGRLHARQRDRVRAGRARRRASRSTSSARGSPSSSTATTTSSRRSPSSAPRGACGRASCASASAPRTSAR